MEKALQEIAAIKKAVEGVGRDVEQPEEPTEEEWPEWYAWDGVTLNPCRRIRNVRIMVRVIYPGLTTISGNRGSDRGL